MSIVISYHEGVFLECLKVFSVGKFVLNLFVIPLSRCINIIPTYLPPLLIEMDLICLIPLEICLLFDKVNSPSRST